MISWEGLGEGVTTGRAYFELLGLVREPWSCTHTNRAQSPGRTQRQ